MICFISCVKKKQNKKCIAKDMYISNYFKYLLKYAYKTNSDKIFILSAKYGVLELNDKIEPYEKCLNNVTEKEKKEWAFKCYNQLKQKNIDFNDKTIWLCGKNYKKYLIKKFRNNIEPLKNYKGIGYQLKFLKDATK